MKPEQLEIIINSMHGEMNTLKNDNQQLKQRLEALEIQKKNSGANPIDNRPMDASINELIRKSLEKELDLHLPFVVEKELRNAMPDYVSPLQFNSFRASISNQFIDKKTFDTREKEISNRIAALETKKVKRFSILTLIRTTNENYKDEVEKKLWEKYGYWLKNKKDIIWGFICVMLIMWAIIAIQWLQINQLEERLNPPVEKMDMSIE